MNHEENTLSEEYQALSQLVTDVETKSDPQTRAALSTYAAQHPALLQQAQHLSQAFEARIVQYLSAADPQKATEIQRSIDDVRQEIFSGAQQNFMESLLAQEIFLGFLLMRFADEKLIRHYDHFSSADIRKMSALHSRLCRSLRTFAAIKRVPQLVQINGHNE